MCGIIGMVGQKSVAASLYDGLNLLQHRGQDAAGIATATKQQMHLHKGTGLVRDVFTHKHINQLSGNYGIGHCRYPTSGTEDQTEAQPFLLEMKENIALAHNGNLINTDQVRNYLQTQGRCPFRTESDSETLLHLFAHELEKNASVTPPVEAIFKTITQIHQRCIGGYAVVAIVLGIGIIAFRDPHGIRPLTLGVRHTDSGEEYLIASESIALDVLGFHRLRDVAPGEGLVITVDGHLHTFPHAPKQPHTPCIFEYVYLARPDSVIENISVYQARRRMGEFLAKKLIKLKPEHDIQIVIPVPDTGTAAAQSMAQYLGLPCIDGFVKNRFIGRTFLMPEQVERAQSVRKKLNPIESVFRGKNVLLVDDSIVRGTTSKQIIQMARDTGAIKVYFASAAPPVRYANVYGIDMPAPSELIAHNRSETEVESIIGADWLLYQDLTDLIYAINQDNPSISQFDTSCFSGTYVTSVTREYIDKLALERSDEAKKRRRLA
jgi:amidophosphoribosyltransferase